MFRSTGQSSKAFGDDNLNLTAKIKIRPLPISVGWGFQFVVKDTADAHLIRPLDLVTKLAECVIPNVCNPRLLQLERRRLRDFEVG